LQLPLQQNARPAPVFSSEVHRQRRPSSAAERADAEPEEPQARAEREY
jgi:hypothetical protein